jgi:hypothetical protein
MKHQRLNPTEAAAYIGSTPKTLAKWRSTGRHSIPFLKFGTGKRASVRYDRNDLDAFLNRCRENGSGINTLDLNEIEN